MNDLNKLIKQINKLEQKKCKIEKELHSLVIQKTLKLICLVEWNLHLSPHKNFEIGCIDEVNRDMLIKSIFNIENDDCENVGSLQLDEGVYLNYCQGDLFISFEKEEYIFPFVQKHSLKLEKVNDY